jgi:hypothetical protein
MSKSPTSAIIPCETPPALKEHIEQFAEVLKTEAHKLGTHGLSEEEFYNSGLLDGAIERIRGQNSATMREKRDFVARILNYMQDANLIKEWKSSGAANRHDYTIIMRDDRVSVIELKGCMDGQNTTIFERPSNAQEFIIWSICPSKSSDLHRGVWSGIHTRLGPEMIANGKHIDGLIVWDWFCGTQARICPKLKREDGRLITVGQHQLPPPCIYLFPQTLPTPKNNPHPEPHTLAEVSFLKALHDCFGGYSDEVNKVRFLVTHKGGDTVRTTSIERDGQLQKASAATTIRRE